MYRRTLGDEHPSTLTALANLSSLHQATGNLDESSAYLSEALSARRRIYGTHHPDTLLCMNNLGTLYQAAGSHQESARLYEEVAEISERTLGKFHPRTLSTINNLVHLLAEMREYSRAVPFAGPISRPCGGSMAPATHTVKQPAAIWHSCEVERLILTGPPSEQL